MDRFEKSLLACIVGVAVLTSAMIDWFPYSLIGIFVITVLCVLVVHGGDWLAALRKRLAEEFESLKVADAELRAIEERASATTPRVGSKEFLNPKSVIKRCDAQHLALSKGEYHYWLYGDFPPSFEYLTLTAAAGCHPAARVGQSQLPRLANTPRPDVADGQSSATATAEAP